MTRALCQDLGQDVRLCDGANVQGNVAVHQ